MPTMDPRYNNSGIAAAMANIGKMFSGSAQDDASTAAADYNNARAQGQLVQNHANQSLADSIAQLMNVNNQPAPAVPSAATPMAGMEASEPTPVNPNAALAGFATNFLQGGMAPGQLGDVILALQANNTAATRDIKTNALVGAGKPLTKDTAIDLQRQDQLRAEDAARAKDQSISTALATPRTVSPGEGLASAMGYYIKPDEKTYNDARGTDKQTMVKPDDMNAIDNYVSSRFGISYDKHGDLADGSNPDLSPFTRQRLTNIAADFMRTDKMDFQQATEAAIQQITGGKKLEVTGSSGALNPFVGDSRQQDLTPEQARGAGGPQSATAPDPSVMTATNPQTGERIVSHDGGKSWGKI